MTDIDSNWTPLAESELGLDEDGLETSALSAVWAIATCTEEEFRPRSYLDIQVRVLARAILDIRERALDAQAAAFDGVHRRDDRDSPIATGQMS